MGRVAVMGCGGSGKSHLARSLGATLGITPVHLDGLHYDADWKPLNKDKFADLQRDLVTAPRWIIDGNYASSLPIRLQAADTVIFLDLPGWACLWGILQRRLRHGGGQHQAIGVYDRITWDFVRYILGYRRTMAPRVRMLIAEHAGDAQVVILRSRRAARRYLAAVPAPSAAALDRGNRWASRPVVVPRPQPRSATIPASGPAASAARSAIASAAWHLGDVHGAAYVRDLHRARLGQPHHTQAGHVLPSFPDGRLKAVARELQAGTVLGARPPVACAQRLIAGADGPVAYYKDANPRNFLITAAGNPVTIDFDDLTLAPFGYDLAKLIVTLAMTHGPIPAQAIATGLSAYNAATARHWPGLPGVTWDELMNWAEIHHILTSR